MLFKLSATVLEVIEDSFTDRETGQSLKYYKAQIWQPGEGTDAITCPAALLEKVTQGAHEFEVRFNNKGRPKIVDVIK